MRIRIQRWLWTSSALIALFGWASPVAQAPVPVALRDAKAAFLVNEIGDLGRFDSLANELRKWGRFTLVDSRESADVVVVLGNGVTAVVGNVNPVTGNV